RAFIASFIMSSKPVALSHLVQKPESSNPAALFVASGVHPHDAKSWTPEVERELRELAFNPEVVAIGQCGLDYHRNFSPPEDQLRAFDRQVALACELGKPLVLHEREAHGPLMEVLARHGSKLPKLVMHGFTGSRDLARRYVAMGCYVGLSGYLWKDKSEDGVRRVLEEGVIPLDHLLLESDAPFLYPNPRASKLPPHLRDAPTARSLAFLNRYCTFQRNEPCSLPVTLEMAAACMRMPADDLALRTTYTALRVYGLSA
ncbi:hypothetical protein LAZ67_20001391, partial [Cordylochernes scorpioides]